MNIARGLARGRGDHPAIVFEERVITYRELGRRVDEVAAGLSRAGIAQGERVALLLPNVPEFPIAYYALMQLGAVAVSINVMSKWEEVRHIVSDSRAVAIITVPELRENVPPQLPIITDLPSLEGARIDAVELERDTPAAILYTSGTTGKSKGAVLSHGNVISNVEATRRTVGMRDDDVMTCFLPLFHCFGQNFIMNATLYAGGTLMLARRFVPDDTLASCKRHGVTMFFGVPTIYIALLERSTEALRHVRYFFSAAAILPTEVERTWHERTGHHIHEGYGLTETSPFASYNHSRSFKSGSIGAPIEGVEMRIEGDEEVGEISIKGPNVMLGYFERDEDTAAAIQDGWFHSGDIGYRDEDGDYFIVDRKKDMINVGGFKVWPREVEEALFGHAGVKESAVIGVPDAYSGEAVKAFVVARKGVSADEIVVHCRERLSAYKVPKHVEIVAAIPKNATGKVLKKDLR